MSEQVRDGSVAKSDVAKSDVAKSDVVKSGVVKSARQVDMQAVSAGRGTSMQVLVGPDDGAPNFALRRFRMEEGGGIPYHTNQVEHEQYVLKGRARITVAGRDHEVTADDSLYIPAGVPHSYEVLEGPFEFICVVPNDPDRIDMVEKDEPPAP